MSEVSSAMTEADSRGRLKIFLGYAAGVGKTYQMLEEAQQLHRDGVDIVIGYFEPHGRKDTIAKTEGLEAIPRRKVEYRGSIFEEMDVDAILARHPQVCVVDEFPHTNVPGAGREKRWQDVLALLEAGIDVLTTMNVQHIESLNDHMRQITGVQVRETVPDWVVREANQVVMVDLTPRALLNRLQRGVVYAPDKATQARQNFFKEPTLVALRELALRQTAHEVEIRQSREQEQSAPAVAGPRDGILIHITADTSTAALIRRGRRVADYLQAECYAVCVAPTGDLAGLAPTQRESSEKHLNLARNLHIETRVIAGKDIATALVEFARLHHVTQIFIARPQQNSRLHFGRSLAQQVVRLAEEMQVIVVGNRKPPV
jgi:two-component system, OmpR family, sensor histidine kinase KdpD